MKNIIKRISAIMIALMLMLGAVINTNVKSIYADENTDNIFKVKFIFAKADHKFEDYYMKVFTNTQQMGYKGEFYVNNAVAIYECTLKKNPDDQIISYRVMEKDPEGAYMSGEIDIEKYDSAHIEVSINGDSGKTNIEYKNINGNSSNNEVTPPPAGEQDTPPAGEQDTPPAEEQDTPPAENGNQNFNQAVDSRQGDDPDADYSVKPGMVVVIDVLFLGALGACVYFVLIKKKNAFM